MHTRSLRISITTLALGACLSAGTAFAQMNPEGGDVWVPPPDDSGSANGGQQQQPQQGQQQGQPWYQGGPTGSHEPAETPPSVNQGSSSSSSSSSAQSSTPGRDDHMSVVGHVGVGYMGVTEVPIGALGVGSGGAVGTVSAPALGIRYWIDGLLGVDVGLGLGFIGGNRQTGVDSTPTTSAFAILIHGGIPLAVFHQDHYKFLIIPEVNLGFSSGTAFGFTQDLDQGLSGFLFQIGGRLGTEIQFGFMGIPQLSLQASVGLYFNYVTANVGGNRAGSAQPEGATQYALGTTVMGEPWDIFLGSLTALYYF